LINKYIHINILDEIEKEPDEDELLVQFIKSQSEDKKT